MILVEWIGSRIVPMPDVLFMDERWLVKAIVDVHARLEGLSPVEQESAIAHLPSNDFLNFYISAEPDTDHADADPKRADTLAEELRRQLRPGTNFDITASSFRGEFEQSLTAIAVVVEELPIRMVPSNDEGDEAVLITPDLRIHIALSDGRWLNVRQSIDDSAIARLLRNIAGPAIGILVILLISMRASHVLLTPLRQLAVAAERLGRERSVTTIPEMRVPEYKAIADSFNNMQTRLKRFIDDRTQMLGAISHDLSTPLTRLRLLAEDLGNPRQREQLLADISEMEMMIRTSLIFARDDAQQEPYVNVDIASLMISLCDTMTDAGELVSYQGPDHASLLCRPIAIRRALTNLVENGCKYGEEVAVELTTQSDAVTIILRDRGPGIDEQDIERAFMPYQRLESSRNRETGGTGLGLTIARDIIHGHGGEIKLGRRDGGGLTVTVTLPRPGKAI
nr:ATP-binding protein [uncultured Dongia sp.]